MSDKLPTLEEFKKLLPQLLYWPNRRLVREAYSLALEQLAEARQEKQEAADAAYRADPSTRHAPGGV